jgi:hypothetical protein
VRHFRVAQGWVVLASFASQLLTQSPAEHLASAYLGSSAIDSDRWRFVPGVSSGCSTNLRAMPWPLHILFVHSELTQGVNTERASCLSIFPSPTTGSHPA